jgi:hypothetical protein
VTALMRVSPDWPTFMKHFNKNFRPVGEQGDLFAEIEAQEALELMLPLEGGSAGGK